MNEIKVAENKTLKLTNVVARRIAPEELGNMMVALTQLQNFIKSHKLITQTEPGYEVDAVLRVKNCLYAHYTGPMAYSQLASSKLQILAFEKDLKLTGDNYTIFVSQDDDDAVVDVFMETK